LAHLGTVAAVNNDRIGCNPYHYGHCLADGHRSKYYFKIRLFFISIIMAETHNVEEEVKTAELPPETREKDTKWYVLRVVSGKERKVKEYLDKDIIRNGWDKLILQIFLPVEKVYKVQNGKKVMRERNFYPGYVMIEVVDGKLSDEIVQHLSNITNVMHFLTDGKGSKGNIISLRRAEVNKMLGKVDEMADSGGMTMSEPFIVGETIKIIDGPFNDFNGVIEEVTDEKKKLKVQVKIFGRATPVELSYMQVEKIS
jgi:transcription termination/antitermination protein NusG